MIRQFQAHADALEDTRNTSSAICRGRFFYAFLAGDFGDSVDASAIGGGVTTGEVASASLRLRSIALRLLRIRGAVDLGPDPNNIMRLGTDIRYAMSFPGEDGGRRIVIITPRVIGFREATNQPRTYDYPFTLFEMHFDKSGKGERQDGLRDPDQLRQEQELDRARELRERAGAFEQSRARDEEVAHPGTPGPHTRDLPAR